MKYKVDLRGIITFQRVIEADSLANAREEAHKIADAIYMTEPSGRYDFVEPTHVYESQPTPLPQEET